MTKPTYEQIIIAKAVKELGIDRPVLRVDQVGEGQFELVLLGGDVVAWPPVSDSVGPQLPSPSQGEGQGEGKSPTPPKPKKGRGKK